MFNPDGLYRKQLMNIFSENEHEKKGITVGG